MSQVVHSLTETSSSLQTGELLPMHYPFRMLAIMIALRNLPPYQLQIFTSQENFLLPRLILTSALSCMKFCSRRNLFFGSHDVSVVLKFNFLFVSKSCGLYFILFSTSFFIMWSVQGILRILLYFQISTVSLLFLYCPILYPYRSIG